METSYRKFCYSKKVLITLRGDDEYRPNATSGRDGQECPSYKMYSSRSAVMTSADGTLLGLFALGGDVPATPAAFPFDEVDCGIGRFACF